MRHKNLIIVVVIIIIIIIIIIILNEHTALHLPICSKLLLNKTSYRYFVIFVFQGQRIVGMKNKCEK